MAIAIIAILAGLLLPALAKAHGIPDEQPALLLAWRIYAGTTRRLGVGRRVCEPVVVGLGLAGCLVGSTC